MKEQIRSFVEMVAKKTLTNRNFYRQLKKLPRQFCLLWPTKKFTGVKIFYFVCQNLKESSLLGFAG